MLEKPYKRIQICATCGNSAPVEHNVSLPPGAAFISPFFGEIITPNAVPRITVDIFDRDGNLLSSSTQPPV